MICRVYPYRPVLDYLAIFDRPGVVLLDSSQRQASAQNRYSYLGVDPYETWRYAGESSPVFFSGLKDRLAPHLALVLQEGEAARQACFVSGLMGYVSYDMLHEIESVSSENVDDQSFPLATLSSFDLVLVFDHAAETATLYSSGLPETTSDMQHARAIARADWFSAQVQLMPAFTVSKNDASTSCSSIQAQRSKSAYMSLVDEAKELIAAGDIFEVNVTQRFTMSCDGAAWRPIDLYAALREDNPAPFSAYIRGDDFHILSASPERFIHCQGARIEVRPIKGTRPRGVTPEQDAMQALSLQQSEKDRAENVMIVDLMRNDLSRVCLPHSVQVPQLCGLESFASVHHLVSVVTGELNTEQYDLVDLLRAVFPAGSITGAPKVRAMEIIEMLELTKRGPYCGSIGCLGVSANGAAFLDLSVVIRTVLWKAGLLTWQAGGAVVLDSDPAQEYQECLDKAAAMRKTVSRFFSLTEVTA